jgi:hypothetical protein
VSELTSKDLLDQIAHWANQIPEAGPIRALLARRPAPEPPVRRFDPAGAIALLRKWREEARSMTEEESKAYQAFIDEFFEPASAQPPPADHPLVKLFIDWWMDDLDNAEFFNVAMRECPDLARRWNALNQGPTATKCAGQS